MSTLKGFEDLKPRDVLSFNSDGTVTVVVGDQVKRYQVQVGPSGSFSAHEPVALGPDQTQERKKLSVAERWANTDQGASAMARGEM